MEEATGRSQWEAPGFDHSAYRGSGDDNRGHGSAPGGGYPPYGGVGGYDNYQPGYGGEPKKEKKDKKSGKGGMLLGAAGGLAVGAVAGAVIAHELSKDALISPDPVSPPH